MEPKTSYNWGYFVDGTLFIISGPSGAGKSSIVNGLINQYSIGGRVITCTTRAPRENGGIPEVDGVDYRFLTVEIFQALLGSNAFAEYASVYGNWYGTLKKDIVVMRKKFDYAFAIVDIQGAKTLMRAYPEAYSIYIHIPREDMTERLRARGQTQEDTVRRLAEYDKETDAANSFEHLIVNRGGKLLEAIGEFHDVISLCRSVDESGA